MKEAIWLACKSKRCCYTAIVVPSGRDVWRIARALDTPAWAFLKYFPSAGNRPDAFYLPGSETGFRLALAKGPTRATRSPAPCTFLMRTRGGYHRCGLGALRPMACRTFPSEILDGVVCVRNDGGCTCRDWSLADVDLSEEAALIAARQDEAREYHAIVARWNDRVESAEPGETFDFPAYCAFLLETYDDLAERATAVGGAP